MYCFSIRKLTFYGLNNLFVRPNFPCTNLWKPCIIRHFNQIFSQINQWTIYFSTKLFINCNHFLINILHTLKYIKYKLFEAFSCKLFYTHQLKRTAHTNCIVRKVVSQQNQAFSLKYFHTNIYYKTPHTKRNTQRISAQSKT